MKKYFLLSQILLLSIYSKSQQPPSKLSVDASVGLSLPVGKFGDKSAFQFANNSAKVPGWANAGPALQLNINYQIQELYGISFLIGGQKNGQDKEALENQARQFNAPNGKFELTTNSWEIFRLMAGGYLKIPLRANKSYFQPKSLGGILKTSIPA